MSTVCAERESLGQGRSSDGNSDGNMVSFDLFGFLNKLKRLPWAKWEEIRNWSPDQSEWLFKEWVWEVIDSIPAVPFSWVLLSGVSFCRQSCAFHLVSDKHDARALQVLALQLRSPSWLNSHGYLIQELWTISLRWNRQRFGLLAGPAALHKAEGNAHKRESWCQSPQCSVKMALSCLATLRAIPLAPLLPIEMFPPPADCLSHGISLPLLSPRDWYFIFLIFCVSPKTSPCGCQTCCHQKGTVIEMVSLPLLLLCSPFLSHCTVLGGHLCTSLSTGSHLSSLWGGTPGHYPPWTHMENAISAGLCSASTLQA